MKKCDFSPARHSSSSSHCVFRFRQITDAQTFVAGQITLVPGSMTMFSDAGTSAQAPLSLRHVNRVLRAMQPPPPPGQQIPPLSIINNAASVVCYVTRVESIASAKSELGWFLKDETDTVGAHSQLSSFHGLVEYVVMPELPRGALVDWPVLALNGHFVRVRTSTR